MNCLLCVSDVGLDTTGLEIGTRPRPANMRPVHRETLEAARAGDADAFKDLTAAHRAELHLHCYRMLGSITDADDLLQETLVAAWRGIGGFDGRSSLRTWLYRIATNRCLNAVRDAKRRRLVAPVPPFEPPPPSRRGELTWLQPYPDALLEQVADTAPGPEAQYGAREGIELAFIATLQRLPPRQTAIVLLCDVLGFSTAEVAAMLDTTPLAVKGGLQRARARLDREQAAGARDATPASERDVAQRFAEAFSGDDVDAVVALLTDDAWLAMPPAPHEYHGRVAIASFLRASAAWRAHSRRQTRLVATRANTQTAFACYLTGADAVTAQPTGMVVLTMSGSRIGAITRFLDRRLPGRFGLVAM
jgi:RNA polymerase sigma-70 factor (ECF subfamily)